MTNTVPQPAASSAAQPLRIALLIDADNVHPTFADEMFAVLGALGVITLRRAYGNFGKPEVQKWHAAMRQHAVAPVHQHDLVAGKNATDIRLAIDAIELAVEGQVDVLAIASSDSDFSPLAIRLRERGMPVIGFAQRGKTAADLAAAFDTFHLLERSAADGAEAKPAARARRTAAKPVAARAASAPTPAPTPAPAPASPPARAPAPAPAPVSAPASGLAMLPSTMPGRTSQPLAAKPAADHPPETSAPAAVAPARRSRAAPRSRRAVAAGEAGVIATQVPLELNAPVPLPAPAPATTRSAPTWPADIAAILAAVPDLRAAGMPLNSASEALRRAGILQGRNASPSRLFKKYPLYFQLRPVGKPETVHFIGQHGG